MKIFVFIPLILVLTVANGDDLYPKNSGIDIRHYSFKIELNDSTNFIGGEATIEIRFIKKMISFELDLVCVDNLGNGMTVSKVTENNQLLRFSHQNNRLSITLLDSIQPPENQIITIYYSGIPADGLIIGKNKFGDRTFFGDNWPNRAHHWLPTIDHPYDKATCEFRVIAPNHYSVIGTGSKIEESDLGDEKKLTHWKTDILLPTKVMVIGVARFAIHYENDIKGIPLQTWVYPQNKVEGFSDYSVAGKVLDYFISTIGQYPFEKLANVQSTTKYGGMENAGNIFYYENSVTGLNKVEPLIAHEVAHQWFGDAASEADWNHVWLSEGFATYFANLYLANTYGKERLMKEMSADRKEVMDYYMTNPSPIVDYSISDITKVLNTNSYQKAGWILHMLRHQLGDSLFFKGVREYYEKFKFKNALAFDFIQTMETVTGKDLKNFFDQWIFKSGFPQLSINWQYNSRKHSLLLTINQLQNQLFSFPLEISILSQNKMDERVVVTKRKQEFVFQSDFNPTNIILDPNVWLLFEDKTKY